MYITMQKIILGVVLVVAVAVGGWWAFSAQSDDGLANIGAGAKLTEAQVQQVVARVSKYMVLPSGEEPSVSVIADVATRAEQQPFYRGAKDGDILIVYSSRAIIYDPKENKLVNVGPIQQNTATPVPSAEVSVSPSPSGTPIAPEKVVIEVRNGTSTAGLAGKTASDLKKNTWVTSTKVADAKNTYPATVIVDLSGGKKPGAIVALEALFGVKAIAELPKGEATSTADVLVIVGK